MERKNTDDLRQEIIETADLDEFLSENSENFNNDKASDLLNILLAEKNISKAAIAKKSGISEVYLHQIFSGKRNPSRNRLICLCFGLDASIDSTNKLLKLCGFAQLYSANRRDAIILYGLSHGMDLFALNDKLFVESEETLF